MNILITWYQLNKTCLDIRKFKIYYIIEIKWFRQIQNIEKIQNFKITEQLDGYKHILRRWKGWVVIVFTKCVPSKCWRMDDQTNGRTDKQTDRQIDWQTRSIANLTSKIAEKLNMASTHFRYMVQIVIKNWKKYPI